MILYKNKNKNKTHRSLRKIVQWKRKIVNQPLKDRLVLKIHAMIRSAF